MGYKQEIEKIARFLKGFGEKALANSESNRPLQNSLLTLLNTALERDRFFVWIPLRQRRLINQVESEYLEIAEEEPRQPSKLSCFLITRYSQPSIVPDSTFSEETVFKTDRESWARSFSAPTFEGLGSRQGMRIRIAANSISGDLYQAFVLPDARIHTIVFTDDGGIQSKVGPRGKRDLLDPERVELQELFYTITPKVREKLEWIKSQAIITSQS